MAKDTARQKRHKPRAVVSFPLRPDPPGSFPGKITLCHEKHRAGSFLTVAITTSAGQSRPAYWSLAKETLRRLRFELQSDPDLPEDEVYVVTSFVGSEIGIFASKKYVSPADPSLPADIQTILTCLNIPACSRS